MRAIETTVTVDKDGAARLDQPVPIAPGRHRAVIVIGEAVEAAAQNQELWAEFIDRTFGPLADSGLTRYPQGDYEERAVIE